MEEVCGTIADHTSLRVLCARLTTRDGEPPSNRSMCRACPERMHVSTFHTKLSLLFLALHTALASSARLASKCGVYSGEQQSDLSACRAFPELMTCLHSLHAAIVVMNCGGVLFQVVGTSTLCEEFSRAIQQAPKFRCFMITRFANRDQSTACSLLDGCGSDSVLGNFGGQTLRFFAQAGGAPWSRGGTQVIKWLEARIGLPMSGRWRIGDSGGSHVAVHRLQKAA